MAGDERGFTIVEVMVAALVLLVGVLGTLALIDRANATTVTTRSREAATNLAREVIEAARGVPYARLTPASINGEIQALPRLGDAGPQPGWTIQRRGFTYTVTASVCTFDDAADGGGDHSGGGFCADSTPSQTPNNDTRPEDYRRVRVEVRWTHAGVEREVHQTELINNPGAAAPAVRTLQLDPLSATLTNDQVTFTGPPHTLKFNLTTSTTPHTLHWLLDGRSQGPITNGAGFSWSFGWPIGAPDAEGSVVDGTYVVSAEAFDRYGVAGASRSLTVVLNRTDADAVPELLGGRAGSPDRPEDQVVDLEWLPTPERDIIGYSVERWDSVSGQWVEIAARAKSRPSSTAPRRSRTCFITASAPGISTTSVTPARATRLLPFLTSGLWSPPHHCRGTCAPRRKRTGACGSPGPGLAKLPTRIAFYRVYRGGHGYDNRYATWDTRTANVVFIDGNPSGPMDEYWVSAVNLGFAESDHVRADGRARDRESAARARRSR